jgi:UDP-N-acetyl-D-galactosamine dehydrogenase
MHNRIVSVIGLGYVGLPVAIAFGNKSYTIGFDKNSLRINQLVNNFDHTGEITSSELAASNVHYTSDLSQVTNANFHIIAVPTPVDDAKRPDLEPLKSVSLSIGSILKRGDIVVYESTVYPGVTEEFCLPILEQQSGLRCGVDFSIGYSPERINPGDKSRTFTNIRKIVSGQDQKSLEIISKVYESVITAGVYKAHSIKVAEAAKVIENTQRDLNIALMNELAIIFDRMGLDTLEVLEAAGTKWNFLPFRPGLVGGHCIGVDPYYLTYKAELMGYVPQVIQAGRRINDNMGRFIARKAIKLLIQNGCSMLNVSAIVLGVTFKENCSDLRNSKVIDLINELKDYHVNVSIHDPVADIEHVSEEYNMDLLPWNKLPKAVNILVLSVAHNQFSEMTLDELLQHLVPGGLVIDVKSILPKQEIIKRGFQIWRL